MTAFDVSGGRPAAKARTILHLDLDAFFCSVEELRRPELHGRPFAVGGKPGERGVVSSCSYASRQFGVRSAMPTARALRLCPGLLILPGRHRVYGEMSRRVMARLQEVSPLVEQISIDEAFLDISGVREPIDAMARTVQNDIRDSLGLPSSIGIGSNKLVAKIATEVGKHSSQGAGPPFALTIVPRSEEASFLAPLPIELLWGVGPRTAAKLADLGMRTIGDVAAWPEAALIKLLGENGRDLARHARGLDERPVVTEHEAKSMSQETTFARDLRDDGVLERTVRQLAGEVGGYLRKTNLAGSTIRLKLRRPDFTTLTRQTTLAQRTNDDDEIGRVAVALLRTVRNPGEPVRLIGVGVSGLGVPIYQLQLWDRGSDKYRRLTAAIDDLRDRYGDYVIHRGAE
jgi:DNA polymerase-4